MSMQPDIELKKAFAELQQKMVETSQKLKLSDIQIDSLKWSIIHSQITDKEMSALPAGTNTYESLGRAFLLRDVSDVRKNLDNKIKGCEEKIKTLENNKGYLERNLKESENNLRELIQQKKDATS
nr:EOG090X0LK7 [Eulimnadia texana]